MIRRIIILCILICAFFVAGCESNDIEQTEESLDITFSGTGADESDHFFFKNRENNKVTVFFYEPFYSIPSVQTTDDSFEYKITDISNWGFSLEIVNTGFWKDTAFEVSGTLADGRQFCYEDDGGIDGAVGGKLFTLDGIFQDVCVAGNFSQLEEQFCENNTLSSVVLECEKNCYSDGGPAVCADGSNVNEACEDPTPENDFFTKNFVTYNGLIHEDYCIGQIHGTKKQLTEMTCEDSKLKEVNQFCAYGCVDGRCLEEENLLLPELTFGVVVDENRTAGDFIDFRMFANDDTGLHSLVLEEINLTSEKIIAFKNCGLKSSCNQTLKIKNRGEGLFLYRAIATNFYNNTVSKNVSLNFSSDLSAPEIALAVSPTVLNESNFTTVNISIEDNRGIAYYLLYEQPLNDENELLTTKNCEEDTFCKGSYLIKYNTSGFYTLMVTSVDTDGNSAFVTKNLEVRSVNYTEDEVPPVVEFSLDQETLFAGDYVGVDYEVTEDTELGNIGFYKSLDGENWEYVSTLSCGNMTHCKGSFIYQYTEEGTLFYMINATDAQANYDFGIASVLYKPSENETRVDSTPPVVALSAVPYQDGIVNKTLVTYSASDLSPITYMNLYKLVDDQFLLVRTRFCRKETTCEAELVHQRIKKNETFLVIAVDIYGNKAEEKSTVDGLG